MLALSTPTRLLLFRDGDNFSAGRDVRAVCGASSTDTGVPGVCEREMEKREEESKESVV